MSAPTWDRIQNLFVAALEQPPEQRGEYLAATSRDPDVNAEVLSLLRAHEGRGGFDSIADQLSGLRPAAASLPLEDLVHRLSTVLAGRYRVERELGRGGMAIVLLAEDLKHRRKVALKVLQPDLALSIGPARFLKEIGIAAQLTHPHILPLHDSGEGDGLLYYVMPYVEGESLRARLQREGRLPLEDALRIARQVADALVYAHGHDVVHRDIKPENILLEAGHAVVSDFGIARAMSAAGRDELSETGLVIGTPAYMSPEQALAGREIDGRSDVYSLGCVLFEMLTGRPPFAGATATSVLSRHLTEEPPPLADLAPDVPDVVAAAIQRALAKGPADRFPSAAQFADALPAPGGLAPPLADPGRRSRRRAALTVVGVLLAVGMIVLGTRLGWVHWDRDAFAPPPNSVAVLYFSNLSADTADAYLADGLTEELIVRLGQIERLQIKSRTAVQRYARARVDPVTAGHALRVGHLVNGTVRRAGDRLRVTVELVRLPGGDRLWGERYDRGGAEVWAIQEDIARSVATAVAGRLAPVERARLGRQPTTSPAAYDHYLRGNYHLSERSPRALTHAVEEYAAATRIDAEFTAAHARLAYAYALLLDWHFGYAGLPAESLLARGLDASDRALQQDSSGSEAWMARGYLLTFRFPQTFEGATAAFARAIALDPANAEAHHQLGWILAQLAQDSAAAAAYHRALALEPERAITLHHLALLRTMQRRFPEARRWLDSALAISPGFAAAYSDRARVQLLLGELAQARADAETARRLSLPASTMWGEATMALVDARQGNVRAAVRRVEAYVREAVAATVVADYLDVAAALAAADDHERALAIVERVGPRGPRLWSTLRRPELDAIRSHPRFRQVLEESRPPGAPR